jgi:hypothetical protein
MRFRSRRTSRFLSLEFLEQRLVLSPADSYGNGFIQICECCQPLVDNTAPPGAPAPGQELSPTTVMASDAGMGTGEFFQDHQIVGYMSQGVDRGLDLQYSSLQADPRPILQLALTTQQGSNSSGVRSIQVVGAFNGGASVAVTYNNVVLQDGNTYRTPIQVDATGWPTGIYPAQQTVTKTFSDGSQQPETINGTIAVVNLANSPYGAGWSFGDVEQINGAARGASAVLITAGAHGTEEFTTTDYVNYVGPSDDKSTLVINGNNTWTRTYTDGTVVQFNASGQKHRCRTAMGTQRAIATSLLALRPAPCSPSPIQWASDTRSNTIARGI